MKNQVRRNRSRKIVCYFFAQRYNVGRRKGTEICRLSLVVFRVSACDDAGSSWTYFWGRDTKNMPARDWQMQRWQHNAIFSEYGQV